MDKYADELEKAYREAMVIPDEYIKMIPGFRFVGTIQTKFGDEHYYYCNDGTGKYYYDTDYAMRARVRKRNRYK